MKYIGNCSDVINWDIEFENSKKTKANPNIFWENNPDTTDVFEMIGKTWDNAGYKRLDPTIEWETFFELDKKLINKLGEVLNATPWYVWISHIAPGKIFPWHADDRPFYYGTDVKEGTDVRVTVLMQDSSPGCVSIVGNDNIYMGKKGDMWLWNDSADWHCGINLGFEHKWQLNFWGYR